MLKKILFTSILTILFASSIFCQDTKGKELVIIKLQEYRKGYTNSIESGIQITEADGTIRIIPIEKFTEDNLTDGKDTRKLIHKELLSYLNDGYSIISHVKGNSDLILFYEDYILLRE